MKFRFLTIPAMMPDEAQEAVNRFCGTHRVVSVEKQFVHDGERSYWALCLCYLESSRNNGEESVSPARKGKIDYRAVLNEQDFALYVRLRNLRKTLSDQEGIPAYALFTNEQLAAMIQKRIPGDMPGQTEHGPRDVSRESRALPKASCAFPYVV